MAFTYIGDLSTSLDYARFRLDDIDPDDILLPDETYNALFALYTVREGMAQAASTIAARLSKRLTSFGEAGGIRVSYHFLNYYQSLADIIRSEPEYDATTVAASIRTGAIKRGVVDTYPFRRYEKWPTPCE